MHSHINAHSHATAQQRLIVKYVHDKVESTEKKLLRSQKKWKMCGNQYGNGIKEQSNILMICDSSHSRSKAVGFPCFVSSNIDTLMSNGTSSINFSVSIPQRRDVDLTRRWERDWIILLYRIYLRTVYVWCHWCSRRRRRCTFRFSPSVFLFYFIVACETCVSLASHIHNHTNFPFEFPWNGIYVHTFALLPSPLVLLDACKHFCAWKSFQN